MTSEAATLRTEGSHMSVEGALTVNTVGGLLTEGRAALAGLAGATAVLDLKRVSESDSSGLALVVDWLRTARRSGTALEVRDLPAQMAALAEVSGVENLLSAGASHGS